MKNKLWFAGCLISCLTFSIGAWTGNCFAQVKKQKQLATDSVLVLMQKVADWQLDAYNSGQVVSTENGWESAAFYTGLTAFMDIYEKKTKFQAQRYDRFLMKIGGKFSWDLGAQRFFADDYCIAQMYGYMFLRHKDPIMIARWQKLADSIVDRNFDESLNIVPGITQREWAWCDALYMGPPSLVLLSDITGDSRYLKKANKLWWKTTAFLYDTTDHLFYRDSRFFTQRERNGQKIFWSRGNGWVMAGIVHMLENMPKDFVDRSKYVQLLKEMAYRMAAIQQEDGSWHASLLDPSSYLEKETSGTGFICYALAWSVNNGILNKKKFLPVIKNSWRALVTSVHPDGKLGYVQNVGSGPIATSYESSYVYGTGAFLLAGSEIIKLLK